MAIEAHNFFRGAAHHEVLRGRARRKARKDIPLALVQIDFAVVNTHLCAGIPVSQSRNSSPRAAGSERIRDLKDTGRFMMLV
jgi:hypothetical protein